MAEFKTPTSKRYRNKGEDNTELQTPIKIPASPFLQQIGYGTGVRVFTLERSPKVGVIRSPWAIKQRNRRCPKNLQYNDRLKLEAKILRNLKHPNIVGFRAFTQTEVGEPCLAMEKLDISLGDLIEQRVESGEDTPLPAKDISYISNEIAKGLEYLHHTAHLLHGDMKSNNILVSKDLKSVKICDFGVSLPLNEELCLDEKIGDYFYVGTELWSAPEIVHESGPVSNKADIWSFGITVWEMISLSPPHVEDLDESVESNLNDSFTQFMHAYENKNPNVNTDEMINSHLKQTNSKIGTRPALPAVELSADYNHVLEMFYACTDEDYKSRPSAKGLVRFFKNYVKQ